MFYQTESKAQGWRAMARFEDGREALLLIGRSSTQVRQGYVESFHDLLDDEEREQIAVDLPAALARRPGRRHLGTPDDIEGPGHRGEGRPAGGVTWRLVSEVVRDGDGRS